jgi:zinc ribbon protein
MPQSAETTTSQEYWRSPNPEIMRIVKPVAAAAPCWHCGADYSPGAHFCHICGSEREKRLAVPAPNPEAFFRRENLIDLRQRLGLTVAAVVFFLIGMGCLVAAVLTGLLYKADTLVDWQAIQLWRIEWLLAASAAMLAGILLKKTQ